MSKSFKTTLVTLVVIILAFQAKSISHLSRAIASLETGVSILGYNQSTIHQNIISINNNMLEAIKSNTLISKTLMEFMQAIDAGSIVRDAQLNERLNSVMSAIANAIQSSKTQQEYAEKVANFIVESKRNKKIEEELTKREIANLRDALIRSKELERAKQVELEYKIMLTDVVLVNEAEGSQGSGITIKYKDKFYILSAAHLVSDKDAVLRIEENGVSIVNTRVVKLDVENDLLLLESVDPNIVPRAWTVIADNEPKKAEEVYVCGNPLGIEDVISIARVMRFKKQYMYFQDHSYFGSSGGGIFNLQGELIGTISHLMSIAPIKDVAPFVIHGAVRLNVIKQFLEGEVDAPQNYRKRGKTRYRQVPLPLPLPIDRKDK